jgi:hypothetical protein
MEIALANQMQILLASALISVPQYLCRGTINGLKQNVFGGEQQTSALPDKIRDTVITEDHN